MGIINKNDSVGGINENALNDIILELGTNIDNISGLFQEIEMIVYDSSDYAKGDTAEALRKKFNDYQKEFNLVKQNFTSYQNDLIKIKSSMKELDKGSSSMVQEFTEHINAEAKKIV